MLIKKGVPASLGIAIGKAHIVKEENILIEQKEIAPEKLKAEVKRFKEALDKTKLDLDAIRAKGVSDSKVHRGAPCSRMMAAASLAGAYTRSAQNSSRRFTASARIFWPR